MYSYLNLTNRLTTVTMQPAQNGKKDAPPYRLCKLYHYDYDPAKTWLLEFYQWNIVTQKKERRFFSRFNHIKDPKKRLIEAQKWERFINQQLEQGAVYNPESVENPEPVKAQTVLQDLTDYVAYQKNVLVDTSVKSYLGFADKWQTFAKAKQLTELTMTELTPAICQTFADYLVTLKLNNTSRNNQIIRLKAFCSFYTKPGRERFPNNPARHIEFFPAKTESHEPFTRKQATAILNRVNELEDWPLLLFIYFIKYTFARPGKEVRLMKVRDLQGQNVRITSTYSKSSRVKTPTITRPLAELIDRLKIREYDPDLYVFGNEGKPGPVPVDKNHYYRKHRKILDELQFKGRYTLYGWKHTGNIELYELTAKIGTLQKQNGHASPRTTEIYLAKMGQIADDEILEKFV